MNKKAVVQELWTKANSDQTKDESTKISYLRRILSDELNPHHIRALCKLAICLANSQSSLHTDQIVVVENNDNQTEAEDLCMRAISLVGSSEKGERCKSDVDLAVLPYIAMSNVSRNNDKRMKALEKVNLILRRSFYLLGNDNVLRGNISAQLLVVLTRLLIEPRKEERLKWQNNTDSITKGSCDPMRRNLDSNELLLVNDIREYSEIIASMLSYITNRAIIVNVYTSEYRLGSFFRKLDSNRAQFHFEKVITIIETCKQTKNNSYYDRSLFWLATLSGTSVTNEVKGPQIHRNVTRCPPDYIISLYSRFASKFDDLLINKLGYQTPKLLRALMDKVLFGSTWKNAIDLGCGTGLSGSAFRELFPSNFVGVDLSPEMISKAQLRGCYDNVYVEDIESFMDSIHPSSVDAIIACDVLVYFGDLSLCFRKCFNSLINSKGVFAFSTESLPEETGSQPFLLHECARFAHKASYIKQLAIEVGFDILCMEKTTIRKNEGKDVLGNLVIVRKIK